MAERWRPVRGYEERYEVSDAGRLRALFAARGQLRPPRTLRPTAMKSGHLQVTLIATDRSRRKRLVHQLVLEAFVGPCPAGMECRHLNGSPADNAVTNLAWGTRLENIADQRAHGVLIRGERAGAAKLSEHDVVTIRETVAAGVPQADLARRFGVSSAQLSRIVTRKRWAHV